MGKKESISSTATWQLPLGELNPLGEIPLSSEPSSGEGMSLALSCQGYPAEPHWAVLAQRRASLRGQEALTQHDQYCSPGAAGLQGQLPVQDEGAGHGQQLLAHIPPLPRAQPRCVGSKPCPCLYPCQCPAGLCVVALQKPPLNQGFYREQKLGLNC